MLADHHLQRRLHLLEDLRAERRAPRACRAAPGRRRRARSPAAATSALTSSTALSAERTKRSLSFLSYRCVSEMYANDQPGCAALGVGHVDQLERVRRQQALRQHRARRRRRDLHERAAIEALERAHRLVALLHVLRLDARVLARHQRPPIVDGSRSVCCGVGSPNGARPAPSAPSCRARRRCRAAAAWCATARAAAPAPSCRWRRSGRR